MNLKGLGEFALPSFLGLLKIKSIKPWSFGPRTAISMRALVYLGLCLLPAIKCAEFQSSCEETEGVSHNGTVTSEFDALTLTPSATEASSSQQTLRRCPFSGAIISSNSEPIEMEKSKSGKCPFGHDNAENSKKELKKKSKKSKKHKRRKDSSSESSDSSDSSSSDSSSSSADKRSKKKKEKKVKKEMNKKKPKDHPAGDDITQCPYYMAYLAKKNAEK